MQAVHLSADYLDSFPDVKTLCLYDAQFASKREMARAKHGVAPFDICIDDLAGPIKGERGVAVVDMRGTRWVAGEKGSKKSLCRERCWDWGSRNGYFE